MKQKITCPSHRTIICIYLSGVALLALGSFFDYPISCALYDESNSFAIFFAAFGEYPAYLGLTAAGAMILTAHSRQHSLMGMLQCLCGLILVVSGTLLTCNTPGNYPDWPAGAAIAAGLFMTAITIAVSVSLCHGADPAAVDRVALVFCLAILGQLLLVNILKVLWGRPRMRLVAANSRVSFLPWWQPDTSLKNTLTAAGVAADEFKSFPSGHTADATMAMLLAALPCIAPKLEPYRKKLFWFGFIIACVTGFTRIIMGAHYLTDVTAGFLCGFTAMLLAFKLLPEK